MNRRRTAKRHVLRARRAEARGLPVEVPVEAVESLKLVGREWYARGARYYLLRAVGTIAWLPVIAMLTIFEVLIFLAAAEIKPAVVRDIMLALLSAALVVGFVNPVSLAIGVELQRRAGRPLMPDPLIRRPAESFD